MQKQENAIKELKKCTKCNVVKELNQFSKCTSSKDGLQFRCKICRSEDMKVWRKNNEEYCKKTQSGTRIAHGPLVYAIAAGLLFQLHLYDDTLIAFLGFESLKFTKPVKIGDTIHAKVTVTEVTETSKPDRGVMKRQLQVINQHGEIVQDGIQAFLMKRKPA